MIKHYETLSELWRLGCRDMLYMPAKKLDWTAGSTTGVTDNLLACRSMEYDFDPAIDLWLTKHRFTKLQKDYIDPEVLPEFIDRCSMSNMPQTLARRGTVTQMNCRTHGVVEHAGRKNNYQWGNCILGFTFRPADTKRKPYKGVFSMHSRTSYISYMGGYDLALSYKIAEAIAEVRGCSVEDFAFRWYIDTLQWYSIKSVPYLINHDYHEHLDEYDVPKHTAEQAAFLKEHPSFSISLNSYRFLHKRYENDDPPKYGPTHRIWELLFELRRRPDSVPLSMLRLKALDEHHSRMAKIIAEEESEEAT